MAGLTKHWILLLEGLMTLVISKSAVLFRDRLIKFSETKYIYVSTPMNWINAQRYCRERYTDLASMRNESERNKMKMLVKKSAWIGLYRVAWKWSDGQIMDVTSFQKWSTGQPKKIKHYCVTTTHGGWNARPCSDKYAFVCRGE
uniref:C-type lectin domain-containing protein n=1 Tax=Amphiprion ocellaris TaxID=80972 RepID=A0AAQ6AMK3_AMPOC